MCELSVADGGQRCEQNEGDRDLCDDWNDRTENCVQNEMTSGHKTQNWVQNELTDDIKSWNNRIQHKNWIQNKLMDCHKCWNKSWDKLEKKLDSEQADGWSQHLEQKLAKRLGA